MTENFHNNPPHFVTLGMFLLDEFEYIDEEKTVQQTSISRPTNSIQVWHL